MQVDTKSYQSISANLLKRLKLWLKPKPSTIHNLMIDYQWYWDIVNSLPFLRNFLMKTFVLSKYCFKLLQFEKLDA